VDIRVDVRQSGSDKNSTHNESTKVGRPDVKSLASAAWPNQPLARPPSAP
jgi:hypothetical protein